VNIPKPVFKPGWNLDCSSKEKREKNGLFEELKDTQGYKGAQEYLLPDENWSGSMDYIPTREWKEEV